MQSRLLFISPVLLSVLAFASLGEAQECTTDAECGPNFHCDHAPNASSVDCGPDGCSGGGTSSGGAGSGGDTTAPVGADATEASGDPAPPVAPTEPGSVGTTDDGNAEEGTSASTVNHPTPQAPPDSVDDPTATATPPPDDGSIPEPSLAAAGWCEPSPIACATDADCPDPTYCGTGGECQLKVALCESDSECGANYACTNIAQQSRCSSGDPGPGGMTDGTNAEPGVDPATAPNSPQSSDTPDEPSANAKPPAATGAADAIPTPDDDARDLSAEPECTPPEPVRICFPAPAACEDDNTCPSGWTCESVDGLDIPAFEGIERACLPPGWTAVKDDHVSLDEESQETLGAGKGEDDTGGLPGRDTDPENPDPIPVDDPLTPDDSTVALGTQGGSEGTAAGSHSGCSVATGTGSNGTPSPFGSQTWLALVGVALTALRRSARR